MNLSQFIRFASSLMISIYFSFYFISELEAEKTGHSNIVIVSQVGHLSQSSYMYMVY